MNEIIEYEDFAEIKISSKKHANFYVKIDKKDIERINMYKWSIQKIAPGKIKTYTAFYVVNRNVGLLHRYISDAKSGDIVDHINGDTLDNRILNLRICTYNENAINKKENYANNKSGHRGVLWYHYNNVNKWMSYICINKKRKTLGYFDNIEEAIKVRKEAEEKYFGEYKRKSFMTR